VKRLMKRVVLSLVAVGLVIGCNAKEKKEPEATNPRPVKAATVVVVPESVQGKWKSVQIAVADKKAHQQQIYTLEIGSEFPLPGSNLTLKVADFLPHFVMEGTTLTSGSNELRNPAARLIIREGGREIFKGWLFSLYPTTHTFQHPQYGFTLVDYVPAS